MPRLNNRATLVFLGILALAIPGFAQQQQYKYKLQLQKNTPVEGLPPGPIRLPSLCDASGGIYIWPPPSAYEDGSNQRKTVIVKIAPDGKTIPFIGKGDGMAYSVGPEGEVALLTSEGRVRTLSRFDRDGDLKGKMDLPAGDQLNVGRMIHAGQHIVFSGNLGESGVPVLFSLNPAGEKTRIDIHERLGVRGPGQMQGIYAPAGLASDEFGNLFSVRRVGKPYQIVKFNLLGEVLGQYEVLPPTEDAMLFHMGASNRNIAFVFTTVRTNENGTHTADTGSALIRVLNEDTRGFIDFTLPEDTPTPDCFVGPGTFTAIDPAGADNKMHIIKLGT